MALAELLLAKASAFDSKRGLGVKGPTNDYIAWQSCSAARIGEILTEARHELAVLLVNGYESGEDLQRFLIRHSLNSIKTGGGDPLSVKVQRVQWTCLDDLDTVDGPTAIQRLRAIANILGEV